MSTARLAAHVNRGSIAAAPAPVETAVRKDRRVIIFNIFSESELDAGC